MSNVKRKDSKNRNLRNGESQRKDGRYVYKYTDIYGKPQFIYSWKLVPTDKTPAGKRDDISLWGIKFCSLHPASYRSVVRKIRIIAGFLKLFIIRLVSYWAVRFTRKVV